MGWISSSWTVSYGSTISTHTSSIIILSSPSASEFEDGGILGQDPLFLGVLWGGARHIAEQAVVGVAASWERVDHINSNWEVLSLLNFHHGAGLANYHLFCWFLWVDVAFVRAKINIYTFAVSIESASWDVENCSTPFKAFGRNELLSTQRDWMNGDLFAWRWGCIRSELLESKAQQAMISIFRKNLRFDKLILILILYK